MADARSDGAAGPGPGAPKDASTDTLVPELADVGRLARRGLRWLLTLARGVPPSGLGVILAEHLGDGRDRLPIVEETWPAYDAVNVQVALDSWLGVPERDHQLAGLDPHMSLDLAQLLAPSTDSRTMHMHIPQQVNVARVNRPCGPEGQVLACVQFGLYVITEPGRRSALLVRAGGPQMGNPVVSAQIVSTEAGYPAKIAADLRRLALEHNVFRGQVLSFGGEVFGHGQAFLQFHRRPVMDSSALILEPQVIDQVRRQVVLIARHKEALLGAGQHLKRGLLLYGPPGVGKTHTVRYLMAALTDTTVIELSGNALNMIGQACSVARALQPSMIVVEDVDLIAEHRGMHPGHHPMLFQLLNEMDGLAENSDVIFVLTTNRADLLEPALAARPGRVDQAIELTLPDRAAREQLFRLYRGDLEVDESRLGEVLARTDGVTASFIKELLRRAALIAAERVNGSSPLHVTDTDLIAALDELLDTRNAMTRVLLGGTESDS